MFLESLHQGLLKTIWHIPFCGDRKLLVTIQWWGCVEWQLMFFLLPFDTPPLFDGNWIFFCCQKRGVYHMVLKSLCQGLSKNIHAPFYAIEKFQLPSNGGGLLVCRTSIWSIQPCIQPIFLIEKIFENKNKKPLERKYGNIAIRPYVTYNYN